MGKFDTYKIDLKGMQQDTQEYEYLLDNQFFTDIDSEEIQKGKVKAFITVTKIQDMYDLNFRMEGVIKIPCDRCLDDMDLPIDTTAKLIVKLGKEYAEEGDDIVIVPESEGSINISWFMFEFIALTIPIKHSHGPGKCNKQMSSKLKKHMVKSAEDDSFDLDDTDDIIVTDDDSDDATDPRWDALKGLKDNNNLK
ncbi:MAG: DUF177 domain-containing protein [Bacteroidales bacterium]|nr:DUF177 domain-containing protein [Bacteroidales bacterium]